MYIDSVILFSLVVIALIIFMMIYIGRYAKKHMEMDDKEAHVSKNHYHVDFTQDKTKSML